MSAQRNEVVVTIGDAVVPPDETLSITFSAPAEGPPRVVLMRAGVPVAEPWRLSLFAEQDAQPPKR